MGPEGYTIRVGRIIPKKKKRERERELERERVDTVTISAFYIRKSRPRELSPLLEGSMT